MLVAFLVLASAVAVFGLKVMPPHSGTFSGPARVVDGDTLLVDGSALDLWGVDAPELAQTCTDPRTGAVSDCGLAVARALAAHLAERPIACARAPTSDARRYHCHLDGADLAGWLLAGGHAVSDNGPDRYRQLEEDARRNGRGLWGHEFNRPSEWRASRQQIQIGLPETGPASAGKAGAVPYRDRIEVLYFWSGVWLLMATAGGLFYTAYMIRQANEQFRSNVMLDFDRRWYSSELEGSRKCMRDFIGEANLRLAPLLDRVGEEEEQTIRQGLYTRLLDEWSVKNSEKFWKVMDICVFCESLGHAVHYGKLKESEAYQLFGGVIKSAGFIFSGHIETNYRTDNEVFRHFLDLYYNFRERERTPRDPDRVAQAEKRLERVNSLMASADP